MLEYSYQKCLEIVLDGQPKKKYGESLTEYNSRLDDYVSALSQLTALVREADRDFGPSKEDMIYG